VYAVESAKADSALGSLDEPTAAPTVSPDDDADEDVARGGLSTGAIVGTLSVRGNKVAFVLITYLFWTLISFILYGTCCSLSTTGIAVGGVVAVVLFGGGVYYLHKKIERDTAETEARRREERNAAGARAGAASASTTGKEILQPHMGPASRWGASTIENKPKYFERSVNAPGTSFLWGIGP